MNYIPKILILILSLSFYSVLAQNVEKTHTELTEKFIIPTEQDVVQAELESMNVFKIIPRGMFDYEKNALNLRGGGAYYSFTKRTHNYNDIPEIQLQQNSLLVGFNGANYGFIADLGQSSPNLAIQTAEYKFLADYKPPKFIKEIRFEQKKAHTYNTDGLNFTDRVSTTIGNTYLLRAITFGDSDTLVLFKIYRQDTDGGLIIFWKPLKKFDTPKIMYQTDEELSAKVQKILVENGFDTTTYEVKENIIKLKGVIKSERFTEVIFLIRKLEARGVEIFY